MSQVKPKSRYELKYLMSHGASVILREKLLEYMKPDPHMGDQDGYFNHSVYFDSPHYHFYSEKHEGLLLRVKPRLRAYRPGQNREPSAYFLEFKNRDDRTVYKERVKVSKDLAKRLLKPANLDFTPEIENCPVLSKFFYLNKRHGLMPQVSVLYRRKAYYSDLYPNLRITFDTLLQSSWSTSPNSPPSAFRYAMPANQMLVEIKFNDVMPNIIQKEITASELKQVTFSKYATCLECNFQAGTNNLRNYF